jgi:RNA polymerase sigma factor (TIGR02999 family)
LFTKPSSASSISPTPAGRAAPTSIASPLAPCAASRVLVNHARDHNRLKRGGGIARISLNDDDSIAPDEPDFVALDAALEKLGGIDERKEQIVQLRYFGGFSIDDTARILDISSAQVKRDWTTARAFLLRELSADSR